MRPQKSRPESEDRRLTENAFLRQNIADLESIGNDYADIMLMDTSVHVDLDRVSGSFTPPPRANAIFANRQISTPRFIDRLNIDLSYDRSLERFSVLKGAVMFDNGHGIGIQPPVYIEEEGGEYHYVDLHRFVPGMATASTRITRWPTEVVQEFFAKSGFKLPMAPLEAAWEHIIPTIEQTQQTVVTARKIVALSSSQDMVVTEQVIQCTPTLGEEDLEEHDQSWLRRKSRLVPNIDPPQRELQNESGSLRELSLQVVDYSKLVVKSTEAVLRSESPREVPRFKGVYTHEGLREMTPPSNSMYVESAGTDIEVVGGTLITDRPKLTQGIVDIIRSLHTARKKLLG